MIKEGLVTMEGKKRIEILDQITLEKYLYNLFHNNKDNYQGSL